MLPQNLRLLDFHVVFPERLCALKMLRCALMVSGLVERQRKIVVCLSGLRIRLFGFREMLFCHVPMPLAVMFDAGRNVTFRL